MTHFPPNLELLSRSPPLLSPVAFPSPLTYDGGGEAVSLSQVHDFRRRVY